MWRLLVGGFIYLAIIGIIGGLFFGHGGAQSYDRPEPDTEPPTIRQINKNNIKR